MIKTFGKSTCTLCNREWMEIVKLSRTTPRSTHKFFQGSIGVMDRRNPPVMMSTKSVNKLSWRPQTHSREESIQLIQMGMNL
jgi:hypothetical protein